MMIKLTDALVFSLGWSTVALAQEYPNVRRVAAQQGEIEYAPDCFTDTTSLYQAMVHANPVAHTVYTICPDTVIAIGNPDEDGNCCVDGDMTLMVKSQTTIQCGHDGSSDNNCVLTGGNTQVFATGYTYSGESAMENVHLKGLTFDAAEFIGSALAQKGDITFTDCVFQNFANAAGVIVQAHTPNPSDESYTMTVTYENCLFDANQQGPTDIAGFPLYAVVSITTPYNPTYFYDCTFRNNIYKNGYAVESHGSPVTMENCNFENNVFKGEPVNMLDDSIM